MGEYEPDDSRIVTLTPNEAPGEPPRTGPREDEARAWAADAAEKPSDRHQAAMDESDGTGTIRDAAGAQQPGYAADEKTAIEPDQDPASADSPPAER